VDAFIQRSRVRGILAGRSEEECSFKYALKNDDVAVDDLVVTSGMGGVFPKGLPLGTVIDINRSGQDIFTEIEVQPAVNFNHLEEVLIILAEQADF
jgi:rod shape-determining protein MreC